MRRLILTSFIAYLTRLRFPVLFSITAGLFLIDFVVPDFIPFVDEILLGLTAAVLASLKQKMPTPPAVDAPQTETRPTPPER